MTYEPRPGTVPFRVLAYLEGKPSGEEVPTGTLAFDLGLDASAIPACMEGALRDGLVFRRQRGGHSRAPFFWSLVDHNKEAPAPVPAPQVEPAPEHKPEPTAVVVAPPASAASAHKPMRIALWSDGTLEIRRDELDLVLFTREEARQIVAYLEAISLEVVRDAA